LVLEASPHVFDPVFGEGEEAVIGLVIDPEPAIFWIETVGYLVDDILVDAKHFGDAGGGEYVGDAGHD
jgi:hypothetical protein